MGRKPKTQTVATPKRGRPRKQKPNGYHYINGAQVLFSDNVEALQNEVIKLNEWCLEWSAKHQLANEKYEQMCDHANHLNSQYNQACTEVIGSHAIIKYLESRLEGVNK